MAALSGRILVVDDDDGVRTAFRRLLAAAGFAVTTLDSAEAVMAYNVEDEPMCIVLDHDMPGVKGLEWQRAIPPDSPLSVVFVTGHGDVPLSVAAMKAGAVDFLTKPVEGEQLIDAVVRALSRSRLVAAQRRERQAFLDRVARLTSREREVAALVIQGLLNKQIAATIGAAEKTVKVHRARLMEKLGVRSVAELARLAERNHTLSNDDRSAATASP
jgi:FixJ family two-component response regulator